MFLLKIDIFIKSIQNVNLLLMRFKLKTMHDHALDIKQHIDKYIIISNKNLLSRFSVPLLPKSHE